MKPIPGLGIVAGEYRDDLIELDEGGEGLWRKGVHGVGRIFTPRDRKVDFAVTGEHTLAYVHSAMGHPAIYQLKDAGLDGVPEAVLMDLDGTSVHSESFWVWVIEQSTARLLGNPRFCLEAEDEPHVSGHSVSEHLQYCIRKYCPEKTVEEARKHYFDITGTELKKILEGTGRPDAFKPAPGLKEFLFSVKDSGIKIGLVTSGLFEKAWPEIVSAFRTLKMGDPLEFYDAIISAGHVLRKGQVGTLGELSPKPHPWLYAETARVGLGIPPERRNRVVGLEDSGAGVISIRLAGFPAIGLTTGNITSSGVRPFLMKYCATLEDAHNAILG